MARAGLSTAVVVESHVMHKPAEVLTICRAVYFRTEAIIASILIHGEGQVGGGLGGQFQVGQRLEAARCCEVSGSVGQGRARDKMKR